MTIQTKLAHVTKMSELGPLLLAKKIKTPQSISNFSEFYFKEVLFSRNLKIVDNIYCKHCYVSLSMYPLMTYWAWFNSSLLQNIARSLY